MDIQRKKGMLEVCVLAVLKKGASYGYRIAREVEQCVDISESTLYPILKRLEQNGCLKTYRREYNGRMRKYYCLTQAGQNKIDGFLDEWSELQEMYRFVAEQNRVTSLAEPGNWEAGGKAAGKEENIGEAIGALGSDEAETYKAGLNKAESVAALQNEAEHGRAGSDEMRLFEAASIETEQRGAETDAVRPDETKRDGANADEPEEICKPTPPGIKQDITESAAIKPDEAEPNVTENEKGGTQL